MDCISNKLLLRKKVRTLPLLSTQSNELLCLTVMRRIKLNCPQGECMEVGSVSGKGRNALFQHRNLGFQRKGRQWWQVTPSGRNLFHAHENLQKTTLWPWNLPKMLVSMLGTQKPSPSRDQVGLNSTHLANSSGELNIKDSLLCFLAQVYLQILVYSTRRVCSRGLSQLPADKAPLSLLFHLLAL